MRRMLILLPVMAAFLSAQEYRGTFSGSVTDATGAAIPKAKVVALETRTNTKSEAVSDATGQYTIPFLSLGVYDITAEAPGFKELQCHSAAVVAPARLDDYASSPAISPDAVSLG